MMKTRQGTCEESAPAKTSFKDSSFNAEKKITAKRPEEAAKERRVNEGTPAKDAGKGRRQQAAPHWKMVGR